MEDSHKSIRIFLAILRALICYILISLATRLSHYFVSMLLAEMLDEGMVSNRLLSLFSALFYFIFFFCYTRLFALYHNAFREECSLCQENTPKFKDKLKALFSVQSFVIHFSLVSFLLLFNSRGYGYLAYAIFGDTLTVGQTILIALPVIPLLMLCMALAHIFAAKSIRKETVPQKERRSEKANRHLAWEIVKITLNSVSASVLIPLVIMLASAFVIFLVFFPALLLIFVGFFVLRYLRALRIRGKFLKNLKKACESRNHRLGEIKYPYRSIFSLKEGENFTLTTGGKTYSCKLLHALKRNSPMFFHSDGYATVTNVITIFRMDVAHYITRYHYAFDSENDKIIIVCPVPRMMYARREAATAAVDESVTEAKFLYAGIGAKGTRTNLLSELPANGVSREMDVGEVFGDYKFFNATGFLNAIERGVLDHK